MARGRKPTTEQDQIDRGNPGRRARTHAARSRDGNRQERMMEPRPDDSGDATAAPAILHEYGAQGALAIWRRLVPELRALHAFDERFDRETFATFCIFVAEFNAAYDDVLRHGRIINTPMTNGGSMLRVNPAFRIMEKAHTKIMELANHFGTSPLTRIKLISQMPRGWQRDSSAAGFVPAGGLADGDGPADAPAPSPADADDSPGLPLADADPAAAFAQVLPKGATH